MKPGLIISSPQMRDPFFERTVVLLCRHDENGAIGLVVNRETSLTVESVLEQLSLDVGREVQGTVAWGGPVEPGTGFIIYRGEVSDDDGWDVGERIAVSPSRDRLLETLRTGEPFLLCLGYAGWGPGQLDDEIRRGSWLITEVDHDVVLLRPMEDRYDAALGKLGLTAHSVWMTPIDE